MFVSPWRSTTYLTHVFYSNNDDDEEVVTCNSICEISDTIIITTNHGRVIFCNSHGDEYHVIEPIHPIQSSTSDIINPPPPSHYSVVSWKPRSKNICIGGKTNGQVTCWSFHFTTNGDKDNGTSTAFFQEKSLEEQEQPVSILYSNDEIHDCKITRLIWNKCTSPAKERFITADIGGTCCMWKMDDEYVIMPIAKFEMESSICCIAFIGDCYGGHQSQEFIFSVQEGILYRGNERGSCHKIDLHQQDSSDKSKNSEEDKEELLVSSEISHLVYNEEKSLVACISNQSRDVYKLHLKEDGSVEQEMRTKLNHIAGNFSFASSSSSSCATAGCWMLTKCGYLITSTTSTDSDVSLWNVWNDDHYKLQLPYHNEGDEANSERERVTSFAHDSSSDVLVAGTSHGKCIFWKKCQQDQDNQRKFQWIHVSTCPMEQQTPISSLCWGCAHQCIITRTNHGICSIKESPLQSLYRHGLAVIQTNDKTLATFHKSNRNATFLNNGNPIKGVGIYSKQLAFWDINGVQVHRLQKENWVLQSDLAINALAVAVSDNSLFIAQDQKLVITDFEGVEKVVIRFAEDEGNPLYLDVAMNHLAIVTDKGVIKVMDISSKEPKLLAPRGTFDIPFGGSIISIKCNADGTIVSILAHAIDSNGDYFSSLSFYHTYRGNIASFTELKQSSYPISHYWDPVESRIIACEIGNIHAGIPSEVMTLFVSDELVIYPHDSKFPINDWSHQLIGVNFPRLLLYSSSIDQGGQRHLNQLRCECITVTLKDFEDLEDDNEETLSVLASFSFYLSSGSLDEACISLQSYQSHTLWKKLAVVALSKERIDVLELCFEKMNHTVGLDAIQKLKNESTKEIPLAEAAIQLDLFVEAEQLYHCCNRLDLLCELYRRRGLWEEVLKLSKGDEMYDDYKRDHFPSQLDQDAIPSSRDDPKKKYTKDRREVLKNLIRAGNGDVNAYLEQSCNADIDTLSWYASYIESLGDLENAKRFYQKAHDSTGLVRIACIEDNIEEAFNIVQERDNPTATYYLGRQLEAKDDIRRAIECYSKSGLVNHAIRLSKSYGYDDLLTSLSLEADKSILIDCRTYYGRRGDIEETKTAQLYLESSDHMKAVATIIEQAERSCDDEIAEIDYHLLKSIEDSISDAPEEFIQKLSRYLVKAGDCDKAIHFLIKRKVDITSIVKFCEDIDVVFSEAMVNDLIKYAKSGDSKWLTIIADKCRRQESYHLSCKAFTRSGDRVSAIEALLKTDDTKSIISYASASRTKQVYILAADYLQSLNWYTEQALIKSILQFYSKAKAFEQIVGFMIKWCDIEASQGEYERAMKVLKEANSYGSRIDLWEQRDQYDQLQNKRDEIGALMTKSLPNE